ncbi:MAG: ribonuclease Z [Lentisphaeria bacterium]|nr:ribonuclease Z [Lentisphaeria bacterium]
MKITTLGTGHGDATISNASSATLIENQGKFYLIDCADGTEQKLLQAGVEPSAISAVFITHTHLDHCSGLPNLLKRFIKFKRYGKNPDIEMKCFLPDMKAADIITAWIDLNYFVENLQFFDAANGFSNGELTLQAFPNRHLGENGKSFSYKFSDGIKTVFYSGDLSADFSDFNIKEANNCDIVFSEMTHFPVDRAVDLLKDLKCGKLVFNHIGGPYQNSESQANVIRKLSALPFPVQFAADGMTFEI